ncbi:MAG: hypothetical protein IPL61_08795 [Myxococcales bacterium]|nr:hypothetical protein [Myxococcales bacterium]
MPQPRAETSVSDLRHFFEYSAAGVQVLEDGLQEIPFGEFLVDRGAINRYQLLRALWMQDRFPGVRLGECAAALGYVPVADVERLYIAWRGLSTVELH